MFDDAEGFGSPRKSRSCGFRVVKLKRKAPSGLALMRFFLISKINFRPATNDKSLDTDQTKLEP
jgi:hypothetical protein